MTISGALAGLGVALAAGAGPSNLLKPRPVDSETYTESFMVMGDMADGTYVQLHFVISNVGLGDEKGACRALLISPGKPTWSGSADVGDDWQFRATPAPILDLAKCRLTAGDELTAHMQIEGRTLDITVAARARATAPPGSVISTKDGFYRAEVLVPWAPARLRLRAEDSAEVTLAGNAYVDHFRSTAAPIDLARQYVRFRSLAPACAMLLLVRLPPAGGAAVGWWWPATAAEPIELEDPIVTVTGSEERPQRVMVRAGALTVSIAPKVQVHRHAPVEEYGVLGAMASSWVGNPVTRTFRAEASGAADCRADGILELTTIYRD